MMNSSKDEVINSLNSIKISKKFRIKLFLLNVFGKISGKIITIGQQHLDNLRSAQQLGEAIKNEQTAPDFDYYDEKHEIDVWNKYYSVLTGKLHHAHTVFHHDLFRSIARDIIAKQNIGSVVNFGVSCAYSDALLADMFSGTKFFGVDRSSKTKALNERHFSADNIRFYGRESWQLHNEWSFRASKSVCFFVSREN